MVSMPYMCNHSGIYFILGCLWPCKAAGTKRLNQFMRGIYSNDVMLPKRVGLELSLALLDFVKSYLYQASASNRLGSSHLGLFPKLHALHELAFALQYQSSTSDYCINPAAHSCSLDEDFIGRCASVSRQVSPRIIAQRTLQRYLAHIQVAWGREHLGEGR